MSRFLGSIHDVLSALDSEFGRQQIKEQRFKEGLNTGKLPGVQGRSTKQELYVGLAEAREAMRQIDEFRSLIRDINPRAVAELHKQRLPNWTCLTCGTEQDPADLIHSDKYCEWMTDHEPCLNTADYIATFPEHKALVKAPGGGDMTVKVCRKHLSTLFDKVGQASVAPIDSPTIEAGDPVPEGEDVQRAFDKAIGPDGTPPETFTLGGS